MFQCFVVQFYFSVCDGLQVGAHRARLRKEIGEAD